MESARTKAAIISCSEGAVRALWWIVGPLRRACTGASHRRCVGTPLVQVRPRRLRRVVVGSWDSVAVSAGFGSRALRQASTRVGAIDRLSPFVRLARRSRIENRAAGSWRAVPQNPRPRRRQFHLGHLRGGAGRVTGSSERQPVSSSRCHGFAPPPITPQWPQVMASHLVARGLLNLSRKLSRPHRWSCAPGPPRSHV